MKIIFAAIIIIAALATSCSNGKGAGKNDTSPQALAVEGFAVEPSDFQREIITTAKLYASEQVDIRAPQSGQVLEIYFKEGERVSKGDRIIKLDDRVWKAELVGLDAELEAARKNLRRTEELFRIEGSSEQEVDMAKSVEEGIRSRMEQLRLNIELANVKAPFSGILGMRDFSEGAYLQEGSLITTLTAVDELKVDFDIAQEYRSSLETGKEITVMVDEDTLNAEIYAVNPVVDPNSRTINVRARMKQREGNMILPGTFAEVLVPTKTNENALLIPTQSVVPRINDQTAFVYKSGKAVRRTIELGHRTADKVEVVNGISAGDTVIVTGLLQLKEGMPVKLQSLED